MKSRRIFSTVSFLFVVVLVLLAAIPVLAAPPVRETWYVEGDYLVHDCGGFEIRDEYQGENHEISFYNGAGDLTKTNYHATMHDRVYNSETGYSVKNVFAYNETYYPNPDNPEEEWYHARGHEFNITIPGYGILLGDMGTRIKNADYEIVWFAGNWQEETDLLCEAMDRDP